MAYSARRSAGRTPPLSQDEDSCDDQVGGNEESLFFNEANGNEGFLIREGSSVVKIHPSNEHQLRDQSKFRLKVVVDYGWEAQYLPGRLLATHVGNKFVGYILKVNNIGAVRIMDLDTKERCLMKVDKGAVMDVEFMHKADEVYIGFVDEFGTFYINKINKDQQSGKLSYHQIFKVMLEGTVKSSSFRRFIWCKYVPDEMSVGGVASMKDCAYQFAVLLDDMIYAGNLVQMASNRDEGCYTINEVRDDLIIIDTHSGPVTDASFAPDGTALATASKDGTVKFFQIYFQEKDRSSPRCLYSWEPHDGRPIDRLMFLDNHSIKPSAESQYWKFMITCTENMTEMKLFTCKTWECLQTILFADGGQWKMEIDVSAHYLMATDISRKAMYLMNFYHDDETARVNWIRELSLPFNVLSFNLAQAVRFRMKDSRSKGFSDFVTGDPEDYKADVEMVYVEANMVVPKSLQQGMLAIDPPQGYCRTNGHHISFQPHVMFKEVKKDGETDEPALADDEEEEEDQILPPQGILNNKSATQLPSALQALDKFRLDMSSPEPPSPGVQLLSKLGSLRKSAELSPSTLEPIVAQPSVAAQMSEQLSNLIGISPGSGIVRPPSSGHGSSRSHKSPSPLRTPRAVPLDEFPEMVEQHDLVQTTNGNISKASSSSSPSREVEEILSPKNTEMLSHRSDAALDNLISLKSGVGIDSVENGNLLPPSSVLVGVAEPHFKKHGIVKQRSPVVGLSRGPEVSAATSDQVSCMLEMMRAQAAEMQDLKREIARLNVSLKKSEEVHSLRSIVETHFKDSQIRLNRMEDTMKKIELQDKIKQAPNVNNSFPPNLPELLAVSIGNIVKKEIEAIVPSTLERMYEPSRTNLSTQVDQLGSKLEAKLTQNIAQILQREKFWEVITNNFKAVTKTTFEQTFNEIFTNTIYPRCENVTREMFQQMHGQFSTGIRNYLSEVKEVVEAERRKDNIPEAIRSNVGLMQDALSSVLQVEVENQMLRVLNGVSSNVIRHMDDTLSRDIAHAFQDQRKFLEQAVMLPRTATPAVSVTDQFGSPSVNHDPLQMQRALLNLAKSGEVVSAFVQACNYGDLQVLMYLCKNMPPGKVFETKLPHQTHVAILQQMATDIHQDTEIKLAYLNAAIGSLDSTDRKTLQSVARVLPVFQASVAKYVQQCPESKLITNIKILEMALVGLCNNMTSPCIQSSTPGQPTGSQHSFSQY